jgi:hypothetical protein
MTQNHGRAGSALWSTQAVSLADTPPSAVISEKDSDVTIVYSLLQLLPQSKYLY